MKWDPAQYSRYMDERGRPFVELVNRIQATQPTRIADLGCGPGNLTAMLPERWPTAEVIGVDQSPDMIAKAQQHAGPCLHFEVGDVADFDASGFDVVISNATLQWVPSHRELLRQWADQLQAGDWLAWQVPGNFDAQSHVLMRQLAASPRWAPSLAGVLRHRDAVFRPADYAVLLQFAGFTADVWETTYLHVLTGSDPVLEWVRGTGLRPVLNALSPEEGAEFERQFADLLRSAYPPGPHGTIFPFRRIFCVGRKQS